MYTIEFTTKKSISERLKNLLKKALQDADPEATCHVDRTTCTISGTKAGPEQLSYLLGIAIGGESPMRRYCMKNFSKLSKQMITV